MLRYPAAREKTLLEAIFGGGKERHISGSIHKKFVLEDTGTHI